MNDNRVSLLKKIDPYNKLEVKLFEDIFPSPLMLASGTLVEYADQIFPYINAGIGAVVPRTTRLVMKRKKHPSPHLYQIGQKGQETMLNAEWTGLDIGYWEPYLEELSKNKQVVMSVSGRDIEECVKVCKILDKYKWTMIEVNVSCAHSNSVHGFITRSTEHIQKLIKSIKDAGVNTPIAIKLGHSNFIVELSATAKDAGADAIVAVNTFGPLFDFKIDKFGYPYSVLGIEGAKGGMSGANLFHIALTDIADISYQVDIPVIGVGGVRTAEDVIKMIMAGAVMVQIYTAAHVKGVQAPNIFTDINTELISLLDKYNVNNLSSIRGRALNLLDQKTNLTPHVPKVHAKSCVGCDKCVAICLRKAIKSKLQDGSRHIVEIDKSSCVGCGHCVSVCPTGALEI